MTALAALDGQASNARLGLPAGIRACLFDLDGVLTQTAQLHAEAWKETFDSFLRERSRRTHEPFVPFDPVHDYERYVDGRPRYDGVRAFLAARGIEADAATVTGARRRKNERAARADPPPWARAVSGIGAVPAGRARRRVAPGGRFRPARTAAPRSKLRV